MHDPSAPALVIMAKNPQLGTVKTRLAATLGHAGSLELYRAFLLDKVDQACSVRGVRPVVAFTPAGAEEAMRELLGRRVDLVAQRGEDLGERLANVADDMLRGGARAVLLIDSDTPTLPVDFLEEAVRAITSNEVDVVLGPASDGGYYLIGLRVVEIELFRNIAWSTHRVLSQTIDAAARARLRLHFLPSWYDVDTAGDLDRLEAHLGALPKWRPGYPARTAETMRRLGRPCAREDRRSTHHRTLCSRRIYENRWMRLDEGIVALAGGGHTIYGVVTCSECVGVLPFVDASSVLLVRQFRYVAQRFTWEIPTGGVHAGEAVHAAAIRELREETGYSAAELSPLMTFHTSKSIVDEVAHLFVAEGLSALPAPADETEDITVRVFPFADVVRMATNGEIVDAMSVLAILATARTRGVG